MNVMEFPKIECASLGTFALEKDGILRFRVAYKNLVRLPYAIPRITVRSFFPIQRLGKYINCLVDAQLFLTINANSAYCQLEVNSQTKQRQTSFLSIDHTNSLVCHLVEMLPSPSLSVLRILLTLWQVKLWLSISTQYIYHLVYTPPTNCLYTTCSHYSWRN